MRVEHYLLLAQKELLRAAFTDSSVLTRRADEYGVAMMVVCSTQKVRRSEGQKV